MLIMYNTWYANFKIKKEKENVKRDFGQIKKKEKIAKLEFGGFDPSTFSLQRSRVPTARPQRLHVCLFFACV